MPQDAMPLIIIYQAIGTKRLIEISDGLREEIYRVKEGDEHIEGCILELMKNLGVCEITTKVWNAECEAEDIFVSEWVEGDQWGYLISYVQSLRDDCN